MNSQHLRQAVCAVLLLLACCATTFADARATPELKKLWRAIEDSGYGKAGVEKLEAFAAKAEDPDQAALAHWRAIECYQRLGDTDGAVAKAEWLAKTYPESPSEQWVGLGSAPRTMVEEWREYVTQHPIPMKHAAVYRIARLYERAHRYEEALRTYDRVLAAAEPDPLPRTKNRAIVITFRVHKESLEAKRQLLDELGRTEDAKAAAALQEQLYPAAAWREVDLVASRASDTYRKASRELEAREQAAERTKTAPLEAQARAERAAERAAQDEADVKLKQKYADYQERFERQRLARRAATPDSQDHSSDVKPSTGPDQPGPATPGSGTTQQPRSPIENSVDADTSPQSPTATRPWLVPAAIVTLAAVSLIAVLAIRARRRTTQDTPQSDDAGR